MPRRADTASDRAAAYVLGTMGAAERARFADEIARDAGLRAEVARWQARLDPLAGAVAPVAPPARVWDAIVGRLDAPPELLTVRADEGRWEQMQPGVLRKTLWMDRAANVHVFLLRYEPGAVIERHAHGVHEECMMLEGEVFVGDLRLVAGDYHLAPRGTTHARITSPKGALQYIRGDIYE